jgi:hypothetical protein
MPGITMPGNKLALLLLVFATSAGATTSASNVKITGASSTYVRWFELRYEEDQLNSATVSGRLYKQVHSQKSVGGHLDMIRYDSQGKMLSQQHFPYFPPRIADRRFKASKFTTEVEPIRKGGRIELNFNPLPVSQHRIL